MWSMQSPIIKYSSSDILYLDLPLKDIWIVVNDVFASESEA